MVIWCPSVLNLGSSILALTPNCTTYIIGWLFLCQFSTVPWVLGEKGVKLLTICNSSNGVRWTVPYNPCRWLLILIMVSFFDLNVHYWYYQIAIVLDDEIEDTVPTPLLSALSMPSPSGLLVKTAISFLYAVAIDSYMLLFSITLWS